MVVVGDTVVLPFGDTAPTPLMETCVAPEVALGFALAGLITVLIPPDLIGHAIGEESGVRGVLIATVAGILTPGGPFLQFPLVASLARGGAGVGPLAAYLTAWSPRSSTPRAASSRCRSRRSNLWTGTSRPRGADTSP